jgi:hydroxymethylbilane synthase
LQPPVRIGTRASLLATTQSGHVQAAIAAALGAPDRAETIAPLVFITTTGDRVQDRRLIEAGGKQLFTKEIEEALLDGRVDLAVHSMTDVPAEQPAGLVICAIPAREDPRDALVSRRFGSLDALPEGARVGTASLRRQAQLLARRPDLEIVMLRGNVDTRLRKLDEGACEAIVLAAAGLNRLGLSEVITELLDPVAAPPAPGQGALALQCREADAGADWLKTLHHAPTALCVAAERGALEALEGSCRTAIGAHARLDGDRLRLSVEALNGDGRLRWRRDESAAATVTPEEACALGVELGRAIRAEAGDALIVSPFPDARGEVG